MGPPCRPSGSHPPRISHVSACIATTVVAMMSDLRQTSIYQNRFRMNPLDLGEDFGLELSPRLKIGKNFFGGSQTRSGAKGEKPLWLRSGLCLAA